MAKKAFSAGAKQSAKKSATLSAKKKPGKPVPKKEAETKKQETPSNRKLKKKEYQKRKYNKKDQSDEDSDFEVVPAIGDSHGSNSAMSDSDSDNDSDLEMDMFSQLKSKKPPALPEAPAAKAPVEPILLHDSEDDDSDQDEKFIAKENIAANRKNKKSGGFQSMGLSHNVFRAVMLKGFKVPTPIQRKCIPLILQGDDVVGMARTGSGKTAAFVIPMLERLKAHSAKVGVRALILSPSRELALQTQKVCRELGKNTDLRSCAVVGGDSLDDQFSMMANNPDIMIATPGRLLHLAVEMDLDMRTVEYVVFDEADRLFEMGFAVQLHEILSRLPPDRQTLLFSATLPKMLVDFAKAGLREPTLIRLDADTKISKDLEMAFFNVKESEKEAALLYLLRNVIKLPKKTKNSALANTEDKKRKKKTTAAEEDKQTILFVATKHHVDYLTHILTMVGYQVSHVYGSLDQTARIQEINRFRNGITNLLVVTDVAARGIDIPILENVINYDFCGSSKVFVHRVGRAARAGRRGWAYSLVTPDDIPHLVDLELFLTRKLIFGSNNNDSAERDYTSELVVGSLPNDAIADDISWVQRQIELDASLEGMYKTAMNAYKMYNRTKPRAAPESYARSKKLIKDPSWGELHPLLVTGAQTNEAEKQRLALIQQISGFRPSETIFEVGIRGTKKANPASNMMRSRRQEVDTFIQAKKAASAAAATPKEESGEDDGAVVTDLGGDVDEEELEKAFNIPKKEKKAAKPKEKKTSFKDEEYYISYTQKDANTERGYSMVTTGNFVEQAQKAQLDLIGDDKDSLNDRRNALRWDSKKKKFVRGLGIGADNKKLIRTESGALIPATYKSGRFNEWSKKTRIDIPRSGETELATSAKFAQKIQRFVHKRTDAPKPLDPLAIDYERKLRKRKQREADNEDDSVKKRVTPLNSGKSELKTMAQIRKKRIQDSKKKAKNARPSKKRH